MAEQGIIPKKLEKIPLPKCPSCLYEKAHKKPWQTHKVDSKIKASSTPGAVVSIDQLESPGPGFIPITKGQPTTSCYRGVTIFVDHVSDFSYVHLNHALAIQETLDVKYAFEHVAEQHGVHIHHYHCDNA